MADDSVSVATKQLLEIDKTIKKLDPAIRAAAFDLLAPLYFDGHSSGKPKRAGGVGDHKPKKEAANKAEDGDRESFYSEFDHERPKDNVFLIAAWLYSQYGRFPITRGEIEQEANEVGLTIPDRSDNTMRQAKHKGKSLYRQKSGGFELTVAGEQRIKDLYSVKRGNKTRPQVDSEE